MGPCGDDVEVEVCTGDALYANPSIIDIGRARRLLLADAASGLYGGGGEGIVAVEVRVSSLWSLLLDSSSWYGAVAHLPCQ